MQLKNFKLSNLLSIGQVLIIALVLVFGLFSVHNAQIFRENTQNIHDHPFTVQGALASIQADVLNIRLTMEEIVLEKSDIKIKEKLRKINDYEADAYHKLHSLNGAYLGPKRDIDKLYDSILYYHSIRAETLRLLSAGKISEVEKRVRFDGICGIQAQIIMDNLAVMNMFADKKIDQFYANAQNLNRQNSYELIIFEIIIFSLICSVGIFLRRAILPPLRELIIAMRTFQQGKLETRSHYQSTNEIGILSSAFNAMAARIQVEIETNIKHAAELTAVNAELALQNEERIKKSVELLVAKKDLFIQAELLKTQESYYLEKQLLEATLTSIGDGVISCDNKCNIIFLNKVAEMLTGWSHNDVIGRSIDEVFNIVNEFTREESTNIVEKVIASKEAAELENNTMLINKNGGEIPIEDSAAPIFQKDGNVVGAVLVFRDVSDKKKKMHDIEFLSYHDKLTNVYNRRFYEEELKRIDVARNLPLTLVMGDLNGLKLINDSFGHTVGDELLQKTAIAMAEGCRADDIIARLGGDEFIIVLPKTDAIEADTIIERIRSILAKEKIKGLEISISFGYATKEEEDTDIQEIFKDTEDDMYRRKLYESSSMRSKTVDLIINTLYEKNPREMLHSQRVSALCEAIATEMNYDVNNIPQVRIAGLMHDIGKIGIDEKILNKVEKITANEYDEIKRHSEIGYRILSSVNEFSEIAGFVLDHHERWDGSGYPKGLKGEEISIPARIIAVADSFDAMTRERTYRTMLTDNDALAEIKRCSGTQFDPAITKVFIENVLGKYD